MRVVITNTLHSTEKEFYLDKDKAILGRSKRSDIPIEDKYISREHLVISKDGDNYYIEDVTLSNWVSYNGEKLVKNRPVEYFDFLPLSLPGNFEVKVLMERTPVGKTGRGTQTSISAFDYNQSENRTNTRKISKRLSSRDDSYISMRSNSISQRNILIFLIITFFVYAYFNL